MDLSDFYNNEIARRFEVDIDGHQAVLEYMRVGRTITYSHIGVPPELEDEEIEIKTQLARHALDFAVDNGLKVLIICDFLNEYIETHPEYLALTFGYKEPSA